MTHGELVLRACQWLSRACLMHAVIPELQCWAVHEFPDVIAWRAMSGMERYVPDVKCVVVECKASRADFLVDREKPFRRRPELGMGELRWFFTPKGLVDPDELPFGWGLAEVNGRRVMQRKSPEPFAVHNTGSETALLVAALRRHCFPSEKFPPAEYLAPERAGEGESGPLEAEGVHP